MTRLDAGRVHDVLMEQAWLKQPLAKREPTFIALIESCLEPEPTTAEHQPHWTDHLPLAMAGWLIASAIIGLFAAPQLWPLELISAALGATTLTIHYRSRHKERT